MTELIRVDSEGNEESLGIVEPDDLWLAMVRRADDRDAYGNPYTFRLRTVAS